MTSSDWLKTLDILRRISDLQSWPADVWDPVLYRAVALINDGGNVEQILPLLDLIGVAPDVFFAQNVSALTLLLDYLPKLEHPSIDVRFWSLWDRAFQAAQMVTPTGATGNFENVLRSAIGCLTEALFKWIGTRPESDAADHFWKRIRFACGAQGSGGRAARGVAAMRLGWLFTQRCEWVSTDLLPFFTWNNPEEARVVWQAFLFGATFSPSLWSALKNDFVAALEHAGKLEGEAERLLYQAFGRIIVHQPEWLSNDEAQRIVTRAPHIGRTQIAWVFWRNLESAEEKAATLWRRRIGPWIYACWQPDEALRNGETGYILMMAALSAGEAFPEAVDLIIYRLPTLDGVESAIFAIRQTKAPEQYPQSALKLIDRVVDRAQSFYKGELEQLLTRIAVAWPEAKLDGRFVNLSDFAAV